ncbi:rna-directed dna polymerase from mobile element jockey-like [Limosa lapponica baueri]|uniref:Rna-directed dna polymerase from mobile element jockey-like n=1 Tax=Limosa lapponica baueri TaxID=1758121 RepID=A0A2I0TIW5_LIMLA|nr:rna-directed dna polymerase from mobile element jockey-like [Limosa lapponica baueri]
MARPRESSHSGAPQGLILGSVPLDNSMNDLEDGAEHTLSKLADNTKPGGVADTAEGCAAIQRDPSRLENWADRNLWKFNQEKCQFLHLGRNMYRYVLGPTSWKAALQRRTSGSRWTASCP